MTNSIRKYPSAPSAAPELIATLKQIPVALLSDQLQRNRGSIGLQPYHHPAPLAGTAVTVRTRAGDNLAILRVFDIVRPGDVLVIDADGDVANALVGGIMTFYAATAGAAGMVIDGAIRDVAEIRERPFPVYARGVNHRGPYKDGPGAINVPVSVGGMAVCPGDIVVGDQDGLVVLSRDEAPTVIEKALLQKHKEDETMQAIREGRWDLSFVDTLEARSINL
jgi:RraA family protein